MTAHLRLFDPEDSEGDWTLPDFVERWFFPHLRDRRRPVSPGTIARYEASMHWWRDLMPSVPLNQIAQADLDAFAERLTTATYRRGSPLHAQVRTLAEATRYRVLSDIAVILRKSGPAGANLHPSPPQNHVVPPVYWPKHTWTLAEARQIAQAIGTAPVPRQKRAYPHAYGPQELRRMMQAILSLWAYTGHRASTWRLLRWNMLKSPYPGAWVLEIPRSVKTGKPDRVAVHPALLRALESCRGFDPDRVIPLKLGPRTIYDWHARLCCALPADRHFSPQAWRRWHAEQVSLLGLGQIQSLASAALAHASAQTTAAHYFAARNAIVGLLPDLFS